MATSATIPIPVPQTPGAAPSLAAAPQMMDPTIAYMRSAMGQPQPGSGNLAGMFTMAPGGEPTPPPQTQMPEPAPRQTGTFGPGQGGAHRLMSMQNLVSSGQRIANAFVQQAQAKQQREYKTTLTKYTGAVTGLTQAKALMQQGDAMQKQASTILADPNSTPEQKMAATNMAVQGTQLKNQAQLAQQQASTTLNDLASDPKQNRIVARAYGQDTSNRTTPEHEALVQHMRELNQGLSPQAAELMSAQPMTMQLTPEAQQQQAAVQAGVIGKPATGGQQLEAASRRYTTDATQAGADRRAQMQANLRAAMQGQRYDAQGNLVPMTPQEIAANPVLSAKLGVDQARQQLLEAQTELDAGKATMLPEQAKMMQAKITALEGNLMMRQKEFGIKVQEEERKRIETADKIGEGRTLTTPEGGTVTLPEGRPLQSWAQQTVVQTQDRLQQVDGLIQRIKDLHLEDNNTPGYLATSRLSYAMGMASDEGSLASEISNIELQRVVNAAAVMKGSSRSWSALAAAMIHTPNAWTDSPKNMLQKLQTIRTNLADMQRDAELYGQKGQHSGEMPNPDKGSTTTPPPAPTSGSGINYGSLPKAP